MQTSQPAKSLHNQHAPYASYAELKFRITCHKATTDRYDATELLHPASDINSYILSYNITIGTSNNRQSLYLPLYGNINGSDIVSSITGSESPSDAGKRRTYIDPESPENLKKFTDDLEAIVAGRQSSSLSLASSTTDRTNSVSVELIMNVRYDKKSWKSDHFHNVNRKVPLNENNNYENKRIDNQPKSNNAVGTTSDAGLNIDELIVQDLSNYLVEHLKIEINLYSNSKKKKNSNISSNDSVTSSVVATSMESNRNRNRINGYVKELFGKRSHYLFKNDTQIEALIDLIMTYYINQQNNYNMSEGVVYIIRAIKHNNKVDIISNQIVNFLNLFLKLHDKNDMAALEKIFLEMHSTLLERFLAYASGISNVKIDSMPFSRHTNKLDHYSFFLRPQNDKFLSVIELGTVALIKTGGTVTGRKTFAAPSTGTAIGDQRIGGSDRNGLFALASVRKGEVVSSVINLYIKSIFPLRKAFMTTLFKAYMYIGDTGASLQLFEKMLSNNVMIESSAITVIISSMLFSHSTDREEGRYLERGSDQLELAYSLTKLLHKRNYFANAVLYSSLFDRLICNSFSGKNDDADDDAAMNGGQGRVNADDVNDELKILLIVKDLLHSNYNNVLLREIANNIIGSIKRHGDNGDNTKKNGLYRNILLLLLDKE